MHTASARRLGKRHNTVDSRSQLRHPCSKWRTKAEAVHSCRLKSRGGDVKVGSMDVSLVKDSSHRQRLVRWLKTWWRCHKSNRSPDHGLVCGEGVICQPLDLSSDARLNTSCNMSITPDLFNRYPDAFTKSLADEGILTYSNPVSKMPVLSVCHGFLDSELVAVNSSYQDERRYRKSIEHLSEDKQESYLRLFSAQYPLEPLVDGLPGSVWLECVEPTLCILKALHSLKRRKSNLSLRKCSMATVDSNAAGHGDFQHLPHLFDHLFHGQRHGLLRMQFLALDGVLGLQYTNNQNYLHEIQEGGNQIQVATNMADVQRRRRTRQFRPYVVRDLQGNAFDERETNYDYGARGFPGI
ncbi:hypothetical protein BsWGS_27851 [Bradybaena similaris]